MRHEQQLPGLYLAGPLFSDAELLFNRHLKKILSVRFDVYLPQEDGSLLVDLVDRGWEVRRATQRIFEDDLAAIRNASVLFAVLDGRVIDEGAAFEIGFAYALGKPCYAVQTDPRRLLPFGNNPMISGALQQIFTTLNEVQEWVHDGDFAICRKRD